MTDGRFEASVDLRPRGWDHRHHWSKSHTQFSCDQTHVRDHMERESCPFHDLRADGCFQPEYSGSGPDAVRYDPDTLVKRPDGNRFATGGLAVQPRSRGIGGLPIAHDVEPAPRAKLPAAPMSNPWKGGVKPANGAFSTYEYLATTGDAPPRGDAPKFFNTGKALGLIGGQPKHYPEPFQDPSHHSRTGFRLAAGVANIKNVIGPTPPCPPLEKQPKRSSTAPRPPYHVNRPLQGTFSSFPTYIPDPWCAPSLRSERRPIFTYAAKSKRSMPIAVPWRAGTTAAEPLKTSPEAVENMASSLASVTVRGRQNFGERTLLRAST